MGKREKINSVPIEDILTALGIKYDRLYSDSDYLNLYEGDRKTRGWKAFISSNRIEDFSSKNRACGKPLYVVGMYLGISENKSYSWFEEKFNIY